ncbi:helix-turn-helix transcriptional regulator [Bacillus cereus group sp. BfR-BA-01119]|nr:MULTISPECIES: helix-turn-helix transcriptional regulator [Bacillus cereus group]KXI46179.1 XRE family transcriptional regulator [Bacillus cereus]AWC44308.1 XRE family transcriptional regulator [Bacillus cytotoxicus]MDA2768234.1 helix-turn-helix transcriptional regulator [Bacillus cereus group sp. Bc010]MDH2862970.1 helix-turn-helix transcriptional regulator [Bacillus cytotoxicus]MDH2883101.1 helix-turn-helix transcriptional regulator [Bacillus cytotoxicus]
MSIKDMYIIERRKKKIRLRQLAEYIGCSPSLLSRYETGDCEMDKEKVKKYKEYINSY